MRQGRAETDEQKEVILRRLGAAWRKAPHLRLGQLIANAFPDRARMTTLFYAEDEELVTEAEKVACGSCPNCGERHPLPDTWKPKP